MDDTTEGRQRMPREWHHSETYMHTSNGKDFGLPHAREWYRAYLRLCLGVTDGASMPRCGRVRPAEVLRTKGRPPWGGEGGAGKWGRPGQVRVKAKW